MSSQKFRDLFNQGEFELMFRLSCDRKVLYLEPSRKQDFLMKLHIPVVDKRKKRLNRSCSVLTKAGWIRCQSWVKTDMPPVISSLIARYHGEPCCVIFRFIILFSLELTGSSPGRRGRGSLQEVATCRKRAKGEAFCPPSLSFVSAEACCIPQDYKQWR